MNGTKLTDVQRESIRSSVESGRTISEIARDLSINKGAVSYWVRKMGLRDVLVMAMLSSHDARGERTVFPRGKPSVSLLPKDPILRRDLTARARYYADSKELRLDRLTSHEGFGQRVWLISIVEKPSRVVGFGVAVGKLTSHDTALVLRRAVEAGIIKSGTVLLADVGAEFAGAFESACDELGLTLCRAIGWTDGRMSKPWVESSFGAFTNRFGHRIREIKAMGRNRDENRMAKLEIIRAMVLEWVVEHGLTVDPMPLVWREDARRKIAVICVALARDG